MIINLIYSNEKRQVTLLNQVLKYRIETFIQVMETNKEDKKFNIQKFFHEIHNLNLITLFIFSNVEIKIILPL